MTVLIAYGTVEGQTGKIARHLEQLAREAEEEVILFDTANRTGPLSFDGVDRVILAGSVHERRHPKPFEVFVAANRAEIAARPTLLISVSLSAAFPEGHDDARDYADEMKMRTGLAPDEEMFVAGAVKAGTYGYYETQVLRHVVLRGRDYDPDAPEHEFTDWDALSRGVAAFLKAPARAEHP